MIKYLIDTCTLIGLQARNPKSLELMADKQFKDCAISLVTYIEFIGFYGIDEKTAKYLTQIASTFARLPIDDETTANTIAIRQAHKIKLPDALILATAKQHNLTLLTLDDKLQRLAQLAGVKTA